MFLDLNGIRWDPDPADVDDAEPAILVNAAHEVDEAWTADSLRSRVHLPGS